jgi:hypothetical protein
VAPAERRPVLRQGSEPFKGTVFAIALTPAPATLALFGLSALGLGRSRERRAQR